MRAEGAKTILVAEHEPWICTFLCEVLSDEGYAVLRAADRLSTLRAADQHRPDLILLDLSRAEGFGLETLRDLKSAPTTRDIPVIAVSAGAGGPVEAEMPADAIVEREFAATDLLEQVKRVLSTR